MSKPSRIITRVTPVKLFGQEVPGLGLVKSGDAAVALVKKQENGFRLIDGNLSLPERKRVNGLLR